MYAIRSYYVMFAVAPTNTSGFTPRMVSEFSSISCSEYSDEDASLGCAILFLNSKYLTSNWIHNVQIASMAPPYQQADG